MSFAGAVVASRVWSWFSVLVRDRCEFCVTESRWAQRRVLRTGGRVRARGHSPRAPARTWCLGARASACWGRYRAYRFRTTASAPGLCHPCRTCTHPTRQLQYRQTRRAMRRRQLLALIRTPAPTKKRARWPARRWRWAGCTPRTRCLRISGQ